MSFTCPRCGRTSHNEHDEREGYCGACHDWTGDDGLEWVDLIIGGLNTPGPYLQIAARCRQCGELVASHLFDARDANDGERASQHAIADVKAARAHRARHREGIP